MKKVLSNAEKNKRFWKMSQARQRVAVAQDVINQIRLKFMFAESGSYFNIVNLEKRILRPNKKFDKALVEIKENGGTCNVCGIGSCFVSLVNLGDQFNTKEAGIGRKIESGQTISDKPMRELLRNVFQPRQLSLIESAFETSDYFDSQDNTEDCYDEDVDFETPIYIKRAIKFGERYKTEKNRLIGIMKNIIKNKGTFIP